MSGKHIPSGLVLLDKPCGLSSFRALSSIKKRSGTKKVGHTGTLDPFASGLMVVLVGKYTKFNPLITGMDKTYTAVYKLGEETDTLDCTGEITQKGPIPDIDSLETHIKSLTGTINQKPPLFSAIKINGKRAYKEARKGKEVEIPEREVQIYKHEILNYNPPFLSVRISCSKGTYIRSLARDLGYLCHSFAHVTELRRENIGNFSISDAVTPEDFQVDKNLLNLNGCQKSLPMLDFVIIDNQKLIKRISLGQQLPSSEFTSIIFSGKDTVLTDNQGNLLAVTYFDGTRLRYRFVA